MNFVAATVTAGMSAFCGALLCAAMVQSGLSAALLASACAAFYGASGISLSRIGMVPGFDLRIIVLFKVTRAVAVCFIAYALASAYHLNFAAVAVPFAAGIFFASTAEIFLIDNKNSKPPVKT